jgi:hypothetical protein
VAESSADAVIQAVRAAFTGVPLPPAESLKNDRCQEHTETWQRFLDGSAGFMPWEAAAAMPGRAIETSLLTIPAWRYYLPALLIWCVRDAATVDVLLDNVAHTLSRRSDNRFEARSRGFSRDQRESVALFLEWYQDRQLADGCTPGDGRLRHVPRGIAYWRTIAC